MELWRLGMHDVFLGLVFLNLVLELVSFLYNIWFFYGYLNLVLIKYLITEFLMLPIFLRCRHCFRFGLRYLQLKPWSYLIFNMLTRTSENLLWNVFVKWGKTLPVLWLDHGKDREIRAKKFAWQTIKFI